METLIPSSAIEGRGIYPKEEMQRMRSLANAFKRSPALKKIIEEFTFTQKDKQLAPHPELSIYDGFPTTKDKNTMRTFHESRLEDRYATSLKFEEERFHHLAAMLCLRNDWPMPADAFQHFSKIHLDRITGARPSPFLTIPEVITDIQAMLETHSLAKNEEEMLKNYLAEITGRKNWLPSRDRCAA